MGNILAGRTRFSYELVESGYLVNLWRPSLVALFDGRNNDFHDAMDEPVACFGFGTAVLNVLGYATLGVLPIYDAYDSVVTCEVVPDKASHGRRMTLHAYNESWTSLFGATGALMPFSKPSDSRFSTGWHQDHGLISTRDMEDEQIALRRKAIAHAIVAVLRAMESAAEIPDKD